MNTQELHIELDLLLQKVNSHWNQNFLPAEKDLFINREISRYILKRLDRLSSKKGTALFDTIRRTEDLIPLVKTRRIPVVYDLIKKEVKILLPSDYLSYISSEVSICCTCKNLSIGDRIYYETKIPAITSLNRLPITVIQGMYSFTIDAGDIPDDYLIEDTVPYYSNKLMLKNAMIILFNKENNLNVDIEYDKTKDAFYLRSLEPFTASYTQNNVTKPYTVVQRVFKGYAEITDGDIATVDVIDEEFKTKVRKSYLSGPKPERALALLRSKEVIYTLNGVIADFVNLTYICKPTKIDLLLQSNSELEDMVLEGIIADTAQRMMGVIGSDGYAKFVQENTLIE